MVSRYQLTVVAIDGGDPPKSGSIIVDIEVVDVNDNAPVFDNNATYEVRVPEDLPAGASIIRVRARDADHGQNGAISYSFSSLTERQHGHVFGIRPDSGKIFIKPAQLPTVTSSNGAVTMSGGRGALDHETAAVHLLSVLAVDHGKDPQSAHATVIVRVDDVNDNSPKIQINTLVTSSTETGSDNSVIDRKSTVKAQVVENAPVGTFVAYASVSDPDSGDYGHFRCLVSTSGVSGGGDYPFALRQTFPPADFQLVAVASLDREKQASYDVTVTCSDGGGLTSAHVVEVEVVDDNDNEPVFSRDLPYEFEINENCAVGTIVGRVSATDIDQGFNGEVEYQLRGPDFLLSRFDIDRQSGTIFTRHEVDRETISHKKAIGSGQDNGNNNYSLVKLAVIASDHGTPSKSAMSTVLLRLNDQDDEDPIFDTDTYTFHVAENQPSGVIVGQVRAIDRDLSPNNRFRYHITEHRKLLLSSDGDFSSEYFDIDPLTGTLSTRISFDHERTAEYHLDVIAKPETSGVATTACITVFVDDVNDNEPMFVNPLADNQTVLVSNWSPRGHVIITLKAVDYDSANSPNSALTYKLISGANSLFAVHPRTGRLSVIGSLTDIDLRDFRLQLSVTDSGLPVALNDTTELRVIVSRDVTYVPSPVFFDDEDIVSGEYSVTGKRYGGVLASEATAVVLAIALAFIVTAILVVTATICFVRHRAHSRRDDLLVANGSPRGFAISCCGDDVAKRWRREKLTGNGGIQGRSMNDGQRRGHENEYTSTMTLPHVNYASTGVQQSGVRDVTCSRAATPLANTVIKTSVDIRVKQDSTQQVMTRVCVSVSMGGIDWEVGACNGLLGYTKFKKLQRVMLKLHWHNLP